MGYLPLTGSQASFRLIYEEPIVHGWQPDATQEEKELSESRANEVTLITCIKRWAWYECVILNS